MKSDWIKTNVGLFQAVQLSRVFRDSKTFPDSCPKVDPDVIRQRFQDLLAGFIAENFDVPREPEELEVKPDGTSSDSMERHIEKLWDVLRREPDLDLSPYSTLIPLSFPYIVPGGRFREIYYWDSYFTGEGLAAAGRLDLLESMIRNFSDLIERYGHIPNGNRVYYLSRSQAPFFCCMLQRLAQERGVAAIHPYLAQLEAEYCYWMDGLDRPCQGVPSPYRRVVMLEDGLGLNRYWDDRNAPREEAFAEDVGLFERAAPDRQADLYRNLRAAAESGWDFSSRWLAEDLDLASIRTTEIIPVDLNCLLYNLEKQLAEWLAELNDPHAAIYAEAAARRCSAIVRYCWNEETGWFFDYSWQTGKQTGVWSLAGVYPLFCHLADEPQARRVAENIAERFLRPGGAVTSLVETTQQWDAPNGWAPLQWVTVQGLLHYHYHDLAHEIAHRFVALARRVYQQTGKMMEKYNVCDLSLEAGGGEYPCQDGFGWTNGVVTAFSKMFSLHGLD